MTAAIGIAALGLSMAGPTQPAAHAAQTTTTCDVAYGCSVDTTSTVAETTTSTTSPSDNCAPRNPNSNRPCPKPNGEPVVTKSEDVSITSSSTQPRQDQSVRFTSRGHKPGDTVIFTIDGVEIGRAVADESGEAFVLGEFLRRVAPGVHEVCARSAAGTACESITVLAGGAVRGIDAGVSILPLPRTGAEVGALVVVASGMVFLGATAVGVGRRRRPRRA